MNSAMESTSEFEEDSSDGSHNGLLNTVVSEKSATVQVTTTPGRGKSSSRVAFDTELPGLLVAGLRVREMKL